MSQTKDNNKIPCSPFESDYGQTRSDLYADCFHKWETCLAGTHQSKYRDPQNPKGMFNSHAGPTGEIYNTDCNQGNAISTEAHPGAHRYWSSNMSEHVGSHRESVVWNGTHNQGSQGEISHTSAGDKTSGAAGTHAAVSGDHAQIRTAGAGGAGGIRASASAQESLDSDGNRYVNHEGHSVHSYNGHTYIIAKGDHGIYAQGGKREKDTKGVEGIYDYNPEEGGSSSESENGAGGDYSSKMYDKNTGYFNPWETLAKEILQPSSKNAENRVKTRQANRIKTLETKGASEEKMARVKSRQASENNRRFATKKTSKTNGKTTTAENESATTSK